MASSKSVLKVSYGLFFIAFGVYTLLQAPQYRVVERWVSPWFTHLPVAFGFFQLVVGLLLVSCCLMPWVYLAGMLLALQATSLLIQGVSIDKSLHAVVLLCGLPLLVVTNTSTHWRSLRLVLGIYFIIIGVDKFFEIITQSYLHVCPLLLKNRTAMYFFLYATGCLQIALGSLLFSSRRELVRVAAFVCTVLLLGIALSVLVIGRNYDIVLYALAIAGLSFALALKHQ